MRNHYLYARDPSGRLFAYWYTHPRGAVPMLNREDVSVQEATPTRRVLGEWIDEPEPEREPAQMALDVEAGR